MRLIRQTIVACGVAAFAAFALAACSDDPSEPTTPTQIAPTSGQTITARAGDTATVTVTVLNANNNPLANQPITFAVTSGGGSVLTATAQSNASGQATTRWVIGPTIGSQLLTVSTGGVSLVVTATASAGAPRSVSFTAGANQTAPANGTVATPPAVTVRDAGGNPVAGVQVSFTSTPGGTITPQTILTDANGIARVSSWQLGSAAGTYTLTANVLAQNVTGNPATITATATAGAATSITPTSGNNATATAGSVLAGSATPSVVVRDAAGNPVPNVQVTFSVLSGGGTLTGATQTTNAQGIATVGGFTLGRTAGPNVIQATAAGAGTTNITIVGTAGPAAAIVIASGNNQAVPAGQVLTTAPSVRVVDANGNAVAGATVTFSVGSGGGTITGATQTTNALGVATVGSFTLGATPGANTLVARTNGAPDAIINATGLAGAPATITAVSGDAQNVVVFRSAAAPVVVKVVDAQGFAVQGATVTFALGVTTAGSLSATSVQTDANGLASTTFTANGVLGANSITATVGNLTPITFTVNTTQNLAASVAPVGPLTYTGTAGTVVGQPAVVVKDAQGNPVPGVIVFFSAYGVQPFSTTQVTQATTNASGVATAGDWTLSTTPGDNLLAASVNAANLPNNPITFTGVGLGIPAGATLSQVLNQPPATAVAGSSVPVAVLATANGVPLANRTVNFQVTGGGGAINGQASFTTVTDGSGVARVPSWTLGTGSGTVNTISATLVNGAASVIITVTNQ